MNKNPFHHLGTLDQVEWFYNRRSEIDDALGLLRAKGNVEVTGPRRIGKTWFLRYISHPTVLQKHGIEPQRNICVFIDCQNHSMQQEEDRVYKKMLACILDAIHQAGIDLAEESCAGHTTLTAFEKVLQETQNRGIRTILFLDEFETIARNFNLDVRFFNHLRSLSGASDINIAYVTASRVPLVDLCLAERESLQSSPFFNIFQPVKLGLFSEQDSRNLIEGSLHRADSHFPEYLMELVLEIGGRHPFFLQMAGHHAFKLGAAASLTKNQRQGFLEKVYEEATRHFEYHWSKLDQQEQYVLAALPFLWQDRNYQEVIRRLRNQGLIVLRDDRDDYFSPLLEQFVRRQRVSGLLQAGPLLIDQLRQRVLLRGKLLNLSTTYYTLLSCLVEQVGQVVSYEDLWQAAWSGENYNLVELVKSGIKGLRNALGDDADCIVNQRGVGYVFHTPPE